MTDLERYRASEQEKSRTEDLIRILPKGRNTVLDIGARDGHFSRILATYFASVTALDLRKPQFEYERVVTMAGDVTKLDFPDSSFDCVFCAEVLEHIPALEDASREIARVARYEIVIGVPFRQDTRVGRTTCRTCGKPNPPWGHVNSFDEHRILRLFPGLSLVSKSFVGINREATNAIATFLMDRAGNPWGSYDQEEPCIHCGMELVQPSSRPLKSRICSGLAARLNVLQSLWVQPHENWIHMVFSKNSG